MTIGDMRPQDPNDQPQKPSPNDTIPSYQVLFKIIMKKKMNTMIEFKKRGRIKGR
jgi:hypothetical protein